MRSVTLHLIPIVIRSVKCSGNCTDGGAVHGVYEKKKRKKKKEIKPVSRGTDHENVIINARNPASTRIGYLYVI